LDLGEDFNISSVDDCVSQQRHRFVMVPIVVESVETSFSELSVRKVIAITLIVSLHWRSLFTVYVDKLPSNCVCCKCPESSLLIPVVGVKLSPKILLCISMLSCYR
jgi:hypothetical protein